MPHPGSKSRRDSIAPEPATIMIVDDDKTTIQLLRFILETNNYQTVAAADANTCLETIPQVKPDLLLLDINLPDMSGIEICRQLRRHPETQGLPIIFVTADTEDGVINEAFASGGNDYLRKPINKIELLARLRTTLHKQNLLKQIMEDEKMRGVLEMAGAVCHELNQPLQIILGYSELLLNNPSPDQQTREQIQLISKEVVRIAKIIQNLTNITTYKNKDYIGSRKIIDITRAAS